MQQSLETIAGILSDDRDAEIFPWWGITYRESMAARIALTECCRHSGACSSRPGGWV